MGSGFGIVAQEDISASSSLEVVMLEDVSDGEGREGEECVVPGGRVLSWVIRHEICDLSQIDVVKYDRVGVEPDKVEPDRFEEMEK